MLCGSLDGRGVWGRMDTCIYIWLSCSAVNLKPVCRRTCSVGYRNIKLSYERVLVAQSCLTLCDPRLGPARLLCPQNSPRKNTGVGSHFLLQGISPIQGQNLGLPHCRQILYSLSHYQFSSAHCNIKKKKAQKNHFIQSSDQTCFISNLFLYKVL